MKNTPQPEREEFANRKLIRPTIQSVEGQKIEGQKGETQKTNNARRDRQRSLVRQSESGEQTHAENFYFQKQMHAHTLMTVVLKSGETVQGYIEWYDRNSVKISRNGKPNLLIFKPGIRYMHKSEE